MQNPFSITFGKEPETLISREYELEKIYDSFSSENPNSEVYILTGIRGSGKTVAMTSVSNHFKNEKNWLCVEINPESDMLEQLASKIYDEGKLKKLFLKVDFDFSYKGFGISISGKEPVSNISSLLKREFEYLNKKNIRVLVTIDEAVSNSYMKVFVHEFQTLIRENFHICLVMTGLYQNISLLEQQKSLTFLYRAPKIHLTELNSRAIANSYKNIFNVSELESIELAKFTKGYAFAYQVLGNILYESGKNKIDSSVIELFDEILQERAYNIIYNELTNKEKELINYSIIDNSNSYILNKMNIASNQLSNYKKALVNKGLLEPDRNKIIIKLPRFKEFISFISNYKL